MKVRDCLRADRRLGKIRPHIGKRRVVAKPAEATLISAPVGKETTMNQPDLRPIICGTDFSEPAQSAANVASVLAERLGTHLLLVHGVDERGDFPQTYWPRFMAEARPRLGEEGGRLRQTGAEVREEVTTGICDEGVARFAERADAQLIVVGASGAGLLARALGIGSVAERIAETAWVPTLVVRDAAVLDAWLREERPLKIFVGADFTPTSEAALRWVEELTKIAPCEVTVGYIDRHAEERGEQALHLPAGAPRAPEMQEMLTHDLREKARALYGRHEVHVHVLPAADRVDLRLIELAREANADLIVVGTHQWHGLSRLRHASVSRRVLHEAKMNVACVPGHTLAHGANAQIPRVRRVLAATDLSTHGGHAVPYAFSMVESGGEVRVVHVVKPAEPHERRLARLRELIPAEAIERGIRADATIVENRDHAAGICEAADRFGADLICIGSHGHSGVLAAAMGSVAQEVIARSCRPVLVVRPPSS